MELLGFFAVWVWWLVSSRRWRRIILPIAIAIAICLFCTSPLALNLGIQGLTFAILPDTGEQTETILLLGRGEILRSHRVETARELWLARRAPKIFASGMSDAQEAIEGLQKLGIPKHQLSGERCSQTTEENAQFSTAVLQPQGIRKILLVTDVPHMWRSQILFQSFGFKVIPHPIDLPSDWTTTDRWGTVLREYAGLLGYWCEDRLRQRTPAEIDRPAELITARLKDWHCHIASNNQK